MKSYKHIVSLIFLVITIASCVNDDKANLPSVEDRIDEAVGELRESLLAPADGWRLDYRPTNQTGAFLILLNFNDDGTVRVQSDVSANNGEFRDHVIAYRIDSSQGLELIMETYGVFHYLFELQRASFGGEFEFVFEGEEGENLIFSSKTDPSSDVTELLFVPASTSDASQISTEATSTLSKGHFQTENLGGIGNFGTFNFHLQDQDYLLSAIFDLETRNMKILGIAEGGDMSAVVANDNIVDIGAESTFSLRSEKVVLDQSITATLNGNSIEIKEIPVSNASMFVDSFCDGQQDSVVRFNASSGDLGNFEANGSLFQVANGFKPSDDVYSINHVFLYDENDNSIADQIEAVFPDVVAFQWYHGIEIADTLFNGIGFVTVDEFNNAEFFLRGYDFTQTGNFLQITFNGNDLITEDNPSQEQLDGLYQLTDEIYSGGEVYMLELLNINGLFEFYNPCNKYKGFLF
ncbi:protein of unknown function [Ekhidna lutea]|uniref:DUF4302 domain-containing protein n=1 Tax=Ekhidna lutea TaxID=447679 RepID=A0A239GJF7_EKHLU|nr:DUF4302 domain-containing protein [Ekhidna lutea]SNS69111.1 protein of unknown function [Ekhidna lutea]